VPSALAQVRWLEVEGTARSLAETSEGVRDTLGSSGEVPRSEPRAGPYTTREGLLAWLPPKVKMDARCLFVLQPASPSEAKAERSLERAVPEAASAQSYQVAEGHPEPWSGREGNPGSSPKARLPSSPRPSPTLSARG